MKYLTSIPLSNLLQPTQYFQFSLDGLDMSNDTLFDLKSPSIVSEKLVANFLSQEQKSGFEAIHQNRDVAYNAGKQTKVRRYLYWHIRLLPS